MQRVTYSGVLEKPLTESATGQLPNMKNQFILRGGGRRNGVGTPLLRLSRYRDARILSRPVGIGVFRLDTKFHDVPGERGELSDLCRPEGLLNDFGAQAHRTAWI